MAYVLEVNGTDRTAVTPIESYEIVEAGPGGISTFKFTMEPTPTPSTLNRFDDVTFDNGTSADRLFSGYITHLRYERYGASSLRVHVTCAGEEILLDWLVHFGVSLPSGNHWPNSVEDIVTAKSVTIGASISTAETGDAVNGIGDFVRPSDSDVPMLTEAVDWTVPNGTLRQRIEYAHRKSARTVSTTPTEFGYLLTIDFQRKLRLWENLPTKAPSDWTKLEIENTYTPSGGAYVAENFDVAYDFAAVPDRVYVVGTGVSGFVGTVIVPRIETILDDPELLTADERDIAGANFLNNRATAERWEFDLTDWTPPSTTIHAGGLCDVVDTATGFSVSNIRIGEIRKTFNNSGRQNWHVTLGRHGPSAIRSVRAGSTGIR